MKPKFPVIMYLDNNFCVYPEEAIKVLSISFPDDRTMLLKETVRDLGPGWIIDSTGQFIQLEPRGKRREWARPLSWLWRFVLSEYSMTEARSITVGEVKELVKNIRDKFPEAPVATDLRRFLKKYDDAVVIDEEFLKAWNI